MAKLCDGIGREDRDPGLELLCLESTEGQPRLVYWLWDSD